MDLIVMGTTGMTGLIHGGLFGTNAERTLRHAPVPVVTVPAEATSATVNKVLFATDFGTGAEAVFAQVAALASSMGAALEVAYINTAETYAPSREIDAAFARLKAASPAAANAVFTVYNEVSVSEGIRDLAQKHNIDLVAMLTHGRTGISHFFRGSIAEDVSATVKTPLLALKG
jgi:nucleotide-binding universal stress UspA family protein